MTVDELGEALAIEAGEKDFDPEGIPNIHDALNACAGLLIIDEAEEEGDDDDHDDEEDNGPKVRLVHYTAQDYLDKLLQTRFTGAHARIAGDCITYLSYEVFQSLKFSDSEAGDDTFEDDKSKKDWSPHNEVDDQAFKSSGSLSNEVSEDELEATMSHSIKSVDCGPVDWVSKKGKTRYSLLDYAFRHWAQHAITSQSFLHDAQLYNFLASGPRMWFEKAKAYNELRPHSAMDLHACTGLGIAAYYG